MVRRGELIIDETTPNDLIFSPTIDGNRMGMGCVPRDYSKQPVGRFGALPKDMEVIPRSQWSAIIKEKEATKSQVSDILLDKNIPSTDQNGNGYCWFYSVTGVIQTVRCLQNQPYVPLNGHSGAAIIKGGRDEGGWCGLAAEFVMKHGIAPMSIWPKHSRSLRNDTEACRLEMAKYKATEGWVDITRNAYDRNLTFDQLATLLLNNRACATDFNWWGHSVMACDLVEVEPGDFGIRIRNSWTDSWGDRGFSILRGSRCKPDGAICLTVVSGIQVVTGVHSIAV